MKILKNTDNIDLILDLNSEFNIDLGKEESLEMFEKETIRDLINPIENYETARFAHKPYSGLTASPNDLQCDIWFYFSFYKDTLSITPHFGGIDYSLAGITERENVKMLKQTTKSFFRLEFYKVADGESPDRTNRKLAFAKNLSIPSGEKILYEPFNGLIYVPIFCGSNFKNKENMFLFWFQDENVLAGSVLTGGTFYMTARFFNEKDGTILNFGNKSKAIDDNINENNDLYYKVIFDRTNYTYEVFTYSTEKIIPQKVGTADNPIMFYEIISG